MPASSVPIRVFCSYAHADENFRQAFETHVSILKQDGLISTWSDHMISAGQDWNKKIQEELNQANIILFFVSADLLSSKYVQKYEMPLAIAKNKMGKAKLISIIVRACDWQNSSLRQFQSLPQGGKPINGWENRDEAWLEVVEGLRQVVNAENNGIKFENSKLQNHPQIDVGHREFISYIGSLYESLDFRIKYNERIKDVNIDILANKIIPGIRRQKLAIICDSSSDSNLIEDKAFASGSTFGALLQEGSITEVIIVSKYSKLNWTEPKNLPSYLSTISVSELENHLFQLGDVFSQELEEYEQKKIFKSYVSVSGTVQMGFKHRYSSEGNRVQDYMFDEGLNNEIELLEVPSVQEYILEKYAEKDIGLFIVLADFGAGKTTLIERLKYEILRQYVEGTSTLKPLLIHLKEYFEYESLDILIERTIRREYRKDIPIDLFWQQASAGEFFIMLDGFDEMAPKSSLEHRAELFAILSRLFVQPCPTILSCRPAYFVSDKDYEEALRNINLKTVGIKPSTQLSASQTFRKARDVYSDLREHLYDQFIKPEEIRPISTSLMRTIHLSTFSPDQIVSFLSKFDDQFQRKLGGEINSQKVKEFLYSVYDIRDLMKRPILLDMIVETVLRGAIDVSNQNLEMGPSSLYEIYTDMQFDRDWQKGKVRQEFLTKEERRYFSQAIALTMLKEGSLQVSYDAINEVVRANDAIYERLGGPFNNSTEEEIANDIRVCTFLTRQADELFRFVHKSFMEYFVASHLRGVITERLDEPILKERLPKEVLYFWGGFGFLDAAFRNSLYSILKRRGYQHIDQNHLIFRRNICCAILYSSSNLKNLNIAKGIVDSIELKGTVISDCNFREWEFKDVIFQNVQLQKSAVKDSVIIECDIQKFKVLGGVFECSLNKVSATDLDFSNAETRLITADSKIFGLRISDCNMHWHGNLNLQGLDIEGSQINLLLNGGVISEGTVLGGKFLIESRNLRMTNLNFKSGEITISQVGVMKNCEFAHTRILIKNNSIGEGLQKCIFKSCLLEIPVSVGQSINHPVMLSNFDISNSLLLGLLIDTNTVNLNDTIKGNLKNKITNSKGFVLTGKKINDGQNKFWRRIIGGDGSELFLLWKSAIVDDDQIIDRHIWQLNEDVIERCIHDGVPNDIADILLQIRTQEVSTKIEALILKSIPRISRTQQINIINLVQDALEKGKLVKSDLLDISNLVMYRLVFDQFFHHIYSDKLLKKDLISFLLMRLLEQNNNVGNDNLVEDEIALLESSDSIEEVLIGYDLSKTSKDLLIDAGVREETIELIQEYKHLKLDETLSKIQNQMITRFRLLVLEDLLSSKSLKVSSKCITMLQSSGVIKDSTIHGLIRLADTDFYDSQESFTNLLISGYSDTLLQAEDFKKFGDTILNVAKFDVRDIVIEVLQDTFSMDAESYLNNITRFELSEWSYQKMRKSGVPERVVKKLRRLPETEYLGKENFLETINQQLATRDIQSFFDIMLVACKKCSSSF